MGYTALAFDLRGFGRSQKRYGDALIRYDRDVVAAAKLARRPRRPKVILVGASLGANAVVAAGAAITPPVDGLVSLSAPGTFRLDAVAAAKRLAVPALFAAGQVDEGGIYATDAKAMYAADPAPGKQLVIVPGAKHGVALVAGPGKVRTELERFAHASVDVEVDPEQQQRPEHDREDRRDDLLAGVHIDEVVVHRSDDHADDQPDHPEEARAGVDTWRVRVKYDMPCL